MDKVNEKTIDPPKEYTNLQWQRDFNEIKSKVRPLVANRIRVVPESYSSASTYRGKTQYQYYCSFINDILHNLRSGRTDYCYYIYQVAEILKYEHDRLQAVWLEKERCFKLNLI